MMNNNKANKGFLCLLFLTAVLSGCSHIDEDEQLIEVEIQQEPAEEQPTATTRNILIEDFTGQRCVNCPEGTKIIESLEEAYPERIIAVGIYSGPFGKTAAGKLLPLSTQTGCDYFDYWQIPSQPYGMVNRGTPISHTSWITAVSEETGYVSEVKMEAEATIEDDALSITVRETALGGTYDGKLQVWVVEDGIVGAQYMPDGSVNKEYIHNHVFRTAVNGPWGEAVSLPTGEQQTHTFTQPLDAAWDQQRLSVVAFVYNEDGVEQAVKAAAAQ